MLASNQDKIKIKNRNLIFKQIIPNSNDTAEPVNSRIALAKYTGLSKMTVTNIVKELIEDELLCEDCEQAAAVVGRKPILLSPDTQNRIIGVCLNQKSISVFSGDLCGKMSAPETVQLKNETVSTLGGKLADLIDAQIRLLDRQSLNILGIGVCTIGPLDSKAGIILNPLRFYGIENFRIKEFLEERYKLPVYIENRSNASAIAEKYFGNARRVRNYIYMDISSGIGGSIVKNGKLSSENCAIGHMTVNIHGKKCHCGNIGCLELYAKVPADLKPEEIDRKIYYFTYAITSLINLFNPETIFLGNRASLLGEDLPQRLTDAIAGNYIPHNFAGIRMSGLGLDAPMYGAIATFIENHSF